MLIGLTVPGPVFSISAYTAPLAGLIRSISAPPVPWLLIWRVCQPGLGTDQFPPHWLLLTSMTLDGWPPPELHAVSVAASALHAASAAPVVTGRRPWRITIRLSSGYSVSRGAGCAAGQRPA
jgi:hypothetical protein